MSVDHEVNVVLPETVTGSWNAVVRVLADAGVDTVFGLPGDDLDALAAVTDAGLRFAVCRDQRNAVFMATGFALQAGTPGVALVGKGPAVTNTVTGLLEAASSAAPVVLVSGGTAVEHRGSGAFQELDQLAVIAPMVKWAARVDHPARLVPMLRRALLVAAHGVPGPVYLEVPDHLLTQQIPVPKSADSPVETAVAIRIAADSAAVHTLRASARPLLLVGGGMRHRNGDSRIEKFAASLGAALACTASGRGAVDESTTSFCGLAGLYTPQAAAALWAETDCVVTLGSRLEETATFQWPAAIGDSVPVVQVNVDATEFATGYAGPKVLLDGGLALDAWRDLDLGATRTEWTARVAQVHEELAATAADSLTRLGRSPELHIAEVLAALDTVLPDDRVLVQENGLQDMWSYSFPLYRCDGAGGSIVPSEQTSLSFGAAAALGVKLAAPERPVVAFVGDGAFALFAVDLPTVLAQGVGLLYVVMDNGGYGWLQSQLDQRERGVPGFSFVDPEHVGAGGPVRDRLHRITLSDKASVLADVTEAWKLCESGHVVVLTVPSRLDDALFGGEQAGGDFPVVAPPA